MEKWGKALSFFFNEQGNKTKYSNFVTLTRKHACGFTQNKQGQENRKSRTDYVYIQ